MPERITHVYILIIDLSVLSQHGSTFICSLSLTMLVTDGFNPTLYSLNIHYVIDSLITIGKLH